MPLSLAQKKRLANEDQDTVDVYFTQACRSGDLDDIIYLCFSLDLKHRANISSQNYEGFRLACRNNHLDVVKLLTQSHRHTKPLKVNGEKNLGKYYAQTNFNVEILDYLHKDPQLIKEKNNIIYSFEEARELFFTYISSFEGFNDKSIATAKWVLSLDVIQECLKNNKKRLEFISRMFDHICSRYWGKNLNMVEKIATYLISEEDLALSSDVIRAAHKNASQLHYTNQKDTDDVFGVFINICNIYQEKNDLTSLIDNTIQDKESAYNEINLSELPKAKHNKI